MVTKNRRKNGIKRKQEGQGRYNYRGGYGRACAKGSNWLQKGFAQCGSLDQNGQSRRTLTDVKAPPTNHSASIQIWLAGHCYGPHLRLGTAEQPTTWFTCIRLFNVLNSSNRSVQVQIQAFWIATLNGDEWSFYCHGCLISVELVADNHRTGYSAR